MDFRQLLGGNCGQVNPIVQLATHANQDHAHQENFGQRSTTNQMVPEHMNENVPNTFKMDELMDQLQHLESERSVVPFAGPGPSFTSAIYNAAQQENEGSDNFFSLQERTAHFPKSTSLPNDVVPASYFNRISHEFHPQLKAEDLQRFQKELADAQEILDALEDDGEIKEEHNDEVTKSESGNASEKAEHPSYLVYNNLSVEDVYGINDLGINFNETEHFYNFVENYVLKNSRSKYKKYRPCKGTFQRAYLMRNENNKIKTPRRINIDDINFRFYKMHIRQEQESNGIFQDLIEDFVTSGQYFDIIEMVQFGCKDLPFDRNKYVFLLTDAYLHEHCFYQAGQTLFAWLKSKPEYRDIIPPNFVMEDKTETTLDIEQRKALTKMFIKAAQRCPINPDVNVQIGLAKLCEIGQDYEKAIDCYTSIYQNSLDWKDKMFLNLGNSLALANQLENAMNIFEHASLNESHRIQAKTNIGLIHLKNGQYSKSTEQFYEIITELIRLEYDVEDALVENAWSRLRLCFELMNRGDLCEAVDNRDEIKIKKYISTLSVA